MGTGELGVVFVHGIASSAETWGPIRAALAKEDDLADVEVLPAFEYSTALFAKNPLKLFAKRRSGGFGFRLRFNWLLQTTPSLDTIADLLASHLESQAQDCERLVLVGHSMGGLVIQRFLVRMLNNGRGRELARIKGVILLACPNQGSGLMLRVRWLFSSVLNRQEGQLRPFDEQVNDTHARVLNQIIHAQAVTESCCPVPFHVYAAEKDTVVSAASARSNFPCPRALPGDHFTILDNELTFNTVKRILREAAVEPLAEAEGGTTRRPAEAVAVRQCRTLQGFLAGRGLSEEERLGSVPTVNKVADYLSTLTPPAREILAFLVSLDPRRRIDLFELARHFDQPVELTSQLMTELENRRLARAEQEPFSEDELRFEVRLWNPDTNILDGWIDFWDWLREHCAERTDASLQNVIVGLDFSLLD